LRLRSIGWLASQVLAGISAFAATNSDDILVLMVFFAQVSDRLRPYHITGLK
jgi:cadmium resistance protein CadD (predicted permease)